MEPEKGTKTGPLARYFLGLAFQGNVQVACFLQWSKLLRSRSVKPCLFINMDETSMKFNYPKLKGLIITKKHLPPGMKHRREQLKQSDSKAAVSFLAFLTHDHDVQMLLPQILLGNTHLLTQKLVSDLDVPETFRVWREESGWVNSKIMCRVLALLARCLKEVMQTRQVVLLMDAYKPHLHKTVYSLANRLKICLLFVPAKLTPLLQPADTHLFAKLKCRLRQRWVELRMGDDNGKVPPKLWLLAVMEIAGEILSSTPWAPAFQSAGLLGEHLSNRVLSKLGWDAPPALPDEIPSMEDLQILFPKGTKVPRECLFKWCLPVAKAKPKAKAKAACIPMLD